MSRSRCAVCGHVGLMATVNEVTYCGEHFGEGVRRLFAAADPDANQGELAALADRVFFDMLFRSPVTDVPAVAAMACDRCGSLAEHEVNGAYYCAPCKTGRDELIWKGQRR